MSRNAKLAICFSFGLVVLSAVWPAQAQRKPKKAPNKAKVPFNATGTVEDFGMGMIKVKTGENDFWIAKVGKATEVHVTGTAEPEVLMPGVFIQFAAQVDRRGRVQGKIAKMLIFTPSTEIIPGVFPDQTAMGDVQAEPPAKNAQATSGYSIAGRINSLKKGKLTLQAGNHVMKCELADELEIEVDVALYQLAKQGDKIDCSGTMEDELRKIGAAKTVFIELTKPLAGPEKKKPKRTRTPRTKKSDDDPEEKKDPDDKTKPDKKDEPEEKDKPEEEPKPEAGADENPERTEKLARLLEPKGDAEARTISLAVAEGDDPITFKTSVRGPAATLRKRFGKPDKILRVQCKVPTDDGEEKETKFSLWIWGPVKMLVGQDGKARFFAVEK